MQSRTKTLLFLTLVAALAAPQPLRACSHGGTEFGTCCHAVKTDAAPSTAGCCHKSTDDAGKPLGNHACTCSAPTTPRSTPTNRTTVEASPLVGAYALPAVATLPTPADIATQLPPAPLGGQAAIPHRILHCSWLI
jgi:hypothetical protein